MYQKHYHLYFIGIGGIGMSGIAELFLIQGYKVSGSDKKLSDITLRLEKLGAEIYGKHKKSNLKNVNVVVFSSAIKDNNPEMIVARKIGVPVISRAEMLAELMRSKYSIAISGAHGKTSTTSITANILEEGGLCPTVVIGGKLKNINRNAVYNKGDFIVAEADESDGSFLKLTPSIAVVTNIDLEHLDFYKDLDAIKDIFLKFINNIPFYGLAILCLDNEAVCSIIPKIKKRYTSYGINAQADLQAKNIKFKGVTSTYDIYHFGKKLGKIKLNLPGIHNVYNSMGAIAVGLELGISFNAIKKALSKKQGVQRRLEVKGERKKIMVVDDYGHHPTEIKTTLNASKESWKEKRLVVVFQPHRYTRTKALFDDFAKSFYNADELILLPVYSAGEDKIIEANSKNLCKSIKKYGHKNARYIESKKKCIEYLKRKLRADDMLLTLGAGDVYLLGEELLKKI